MTSTVESRTAQVVLPPIPAKRYFTIGEVSDLCAVKPHVLRYWEQEFTQLRPMKRRGNRRYYQHHEVLLIRKIRELLYDQGFTINGARNQLMEAKFSAAMAPASSSSAAASAGSAGSAESSPSALPRVDGTSQGTLRSALQEVLAVLKGGSPRL
ncbi:MerR family transcriptional regulator [beta proteobacterium MWH-UniP1]